MRMRASFLRPPPGPLSRSTARNAALLNQSGPPGLGSLMAGRRAAGIGQLLLAVAGFVLVVAWFSLVAIQTYNLFMNDTQSKSVAWVGEAGAAVFFASWLWALLTSLSEERRVGKECRSRCTPYH